MIRLCVLKPIQLKKSGKLFKVSPGGIVEVKDKGKAQPLIENGYVKPLLLPEQTGTPQVARIFSKILDEEVWIVTHTDALSLVPEGVIVYLPEEIRNLRRTTPEEIRTIHKIKLELGGKLIAVNQSGKSLEQ